MGCFAQEGFWSTFNDNTNLGRDLTTTDTGNIVAVSAHNAYAYQQGSESENLRVTLEKIHEAIEKEVDLVELDLLYSLGETKIAHDYYSSILSQATTLDDVLKDSTLQEASQVLYLEIKTYLHRPVLIENIISSLDENGFGNAEKPVVIRIFSSADVNLEEVQNVVEQDFPHMAPYIYVGELYYRSINTDASRLRNEIYSAAERNFDVVEFEYTTINLPGHLSYAKSLGLGTGVWTVPEEGGEANLRLLRNFSGQITTEYPLKKAIQLIAESSTDFSINVASMAVGDNIEYLSNGDYNQFTLGQSGQPEWQVNSKTSDLFGGTLVWDENSGKHLKLVSESGSDNLQLSLAIQFNDLVLKENSLNSIVHKAQNGGYLLALQHMEDESGTSLIFGVYQNDQLNVVSYNTSGLSTNQSYFIAAEYRDGDLALFVNGEEVASGGEVTDLASLPLSGEQPLDLGATVDDGNVIIPSAGFALQALVIQSW